MKDKSILQYSFSPNDMVVYISGKLELSHITVKYILLKMNSIEFYHGRWVSGFWKP